MKLFFHYLKYKGKTLAAFFLFAVVLTVSFRWYHLPVGAVLYPTAICALLGSAFLLADFMRTRKKHRAFLYLQSLRSDLIDTLPDCNSIADEDCQEIIRNLCREMRCAEESAQQRYNDMVDYYTVWAHQIKTPIAAMRLKLQNEDTEFSRNLRQDLMRIERYVEMVLTFLRLGSDSTDYVIRQYDLDSIVRPAVKKFAGEFICKKLTLHYDPLHTTVLTDEKWLSFVVEQVISNAVKYTSSGEISIYLESPQTLCIQDTGIGIAPEDLPRIFENGYTGFNGRMDKRASGIGLYLCKQICDRLGHTIVASSHLNAGTIVRIGLASSHVTPV